VAEVELPWAQRVAAHLDIPLESVPSARMPALSVDAGAPLPTPLDEPTWTEWRRLVAMAGAWSEDTLYGEDGDALHLPATLGEMRRAERWPGLAAALLSFSLRHRRLPYLGTGWKRHFGARVLDVVTPSHAWLRPQVRATAAPSTAPAAEPLPPHPHRDWSQRRLTSPFLQSLVRACAPAWTGVATTFRLPLMDDRILALAMSAPSVPWMQGKHLIRAAAAQADALPRDVIWRPKSPVRGHHEALVAQWRSRWDGTVSVAEELAAWVDVPCLVRALRTGAGNEVSDAWRVLELSAWLEGRRRPAG
jgi:hypothetical protein